MRLLLYSLKETKDYLEKEKISSTYPYLLGYNKVSNWANTLPELQNIDISVDITDNNYEYLRSIIDKIPFLKVKTLNFNLKNTKIDKQFSETLIKKLALSSKEAKSLSLCSSDTKLELEFVKLLLEQITDDLGLVVLTIKTSNLNKYIKLPKFNRLLDKFVLINILVDEPLQQPINFKQKIVFLFSEPYIKPQEIREIFCNMQPKILITTDYIYKLAPSNINDIKFIITNPDNPIRNKIKESIVTNYKSTILNSTDTNLILKEATSYKNTPTISYFLETTKNPFLIYDRIDNLPYLLLTIGYLE